MPSSMRRSILASAAAGWRSPNPKNFRRPTTRGNGAMELAPKLGLCRRIVDLVSTGSTLKANGLVEVEQIAQISSRLAVNRAALKTRTDEVQAWIGRFRAGIDAAAA
jgi:ATP phosphoribosyltransferase